MTRRDIILVAVTALVGVILCAVVVSSGTVGSPEAAVFDAINGQPDWLERPLWVMQLFGLLLTPLVFAAVAACIPGCAQPARRRGRRPDRCLDRTRARAAHRRYPARSSTAPFARPDARGL